MNTEFELRRTSAWRRFWVLSHAELLLQDEAYLPAPEPDLARFLRRRRPSPCVFLNYNQQRTTVPAKRIPISEIRRAPIRHEQLPVALLVRIQNLQETLGEVFAKPLEKWLDEFERDTDPESEVTWWELLVVHYRDYSEPKDLTPTQKKAVFKILLMGGMGEDLMSLAGEFACLPHGAWDEISAMLGPRPN